MGSAHQTLFALFHIRAIFVFSMILLHDEFPVRKASPPSFGTCTGEGSCSALELTSAPSMDNFCSLIGISWSDLSKLCLIACLVGEAS